MDRFLRPPLAILLVQITLPAHAQSWTVGSQTVTWSTPPVIGDGVNRHAEISTSTQGGDPPALDYEPTAIDENGLYTRSAWYGGTPGRVDDGEAKFRITCNFSHFGTFDPIIYPGQPNAGHHHTFIGNKATDEDSNYTSLRNSPASSCSGGPLNATAYWEPSLMYEISPEVFVPVKPNIISFYYVNSYAVAPSLYRILRGVAFIGGVDPADRLNTARQAEFDGTWETTNNRHNGWEGWQCVGTGATVSGTSDADINPETGFPRQLVNSDGSDPWDGTCEGLDKVLVANVTAPSCWDGYNLTSPNGRDHFRYPARKADSSYTDVCPQGWWKVPHFAAKPEFPNGRGAVSGHAWRSKLHFSSDRMDPNPANWHPRGSTFHFDWMNGWDSVVQSTWQIQCTGVHINGTAGDPLTCGDSTISATEKMIVGSASPDPSLSNDPVITFFDYADEPAKDAFGPIASGTVVPTTIGHTH